MFLSMIFYDDFCSYQFNWIRIYSYIFILYKFLSWHPPQRGCLSIGVKADKSQGKQPEAGTVEGHSWEMRQGYGMLWWSMYIDIYWCLLFMYVEFCLCIIRYIVILWYKSWNPFESMVPESMRLRIWIYWGLHETDSP